MTFVHEDPDFGQLLDIVARETGIAAALIEKDYWVTHTLWALHGSGLEIWLKGGTSLSKGFALIHRFSEDLDLMILHGSVRGLPEVPSWTSTNEGPEAKRRAFYDALTGAIVVPGVRVVRDRNRIDRQARAADYLGHYPGALLAQLAPAMTPFIRLEVGRARVVPYVVRPLGSFVHDYLAREGQPGSYDDNRPVTVRCVHPLVTLFEKLDAISRRYARDRIEPDTFVRHYEDAAQIIRSAGTLPAAGMTVEELAKDMVADKDIDAFPSANDPALVLADVERRAIIERAHTKIAPMFWGRRIPLDEACATSEAGSSGCHGPSRWRHHRDRRRSCASRPAWATCASRPIPTCPG